MNEMRARWGLLSTARINERLIPCIRSSERSEVLAVASRDSDKAERYAAEWDISRAYDSYEELLADPDLDVIYNSLPNSLHAEWSIKCAEAGKHILCEKPLAITPEQVDRMVDAASRNNVILQEASMMRYHRQTSDVRELVARGAIGNVRLIRSVFTFYLTQEVDIRLDPDLGGGVLWDLGSYQVSFSQVMLREEPVEVMGWQVSGDRGVDRSFAGQLRYGSGALAQFYCSNESAPAWDAELIGSSGLMRLDLPYQNHPGLDGHVHIFRGSEADESVTFGDSTDQMVKETLTYEDSNAYQDEVHAMVASILDGADPLLPLTDSRANVATVVALLKSAREGRPVSLQ